MKPTEWIAVISAVLGPAITGLFLVMNSKTLKRIAIEKRLDHQDNVQEDILKEVRETNGKVRGLLEWKERANDTLSRHSEKISYLEKK